MRYFFNFEGDGTSAPDLIGQELVDDEAAKAEAERLAADVRISPTVEGGQPAFEWVEVIDEYQRAVARLPVLRVAREPNRLS
jgi:hypothetical protein